jgi:hypothetical protein
LILSKSDLISFPLGLNNESIFYLFNDFKNRIGKIEHHTKYINRNTKVTNKYIIAPKKLRAILKPTPIKYPANE